MIDLDPSGPHRIAELYNPAPARSLTARTLGGLAVTLAGIGLGTIAAAVGLYCLAEAIVTYQLWP